MNYSKAKISIVDRTRKIVVKDMPLEHFIERLTQANTDKVTLTIEPDGGVRVDMADYTFHNEAWNTITAYENPELASTIEVQVPGAAQYLLLLIPKKHREPLFGDLSEEFQTILLPTYGKRMAQLWYWWHTVFSLFPFILRAIKRVLGFVFISKLIGR